ncbi:MAG: nitronate monooxygenase [Gammaproteobacteria bacterium]|nr:nitronate monooxygenase [Gammaproteobacteria bacterium]
MMFRTRVTGMLGIELPIFAFSHSRRVVAAVSRAGGVGVLGAAVCAPEVLAEDLKWIKSNCDGRPFGVDLMIPYSSATRGASDDLDQMEARLRQQIPEAQKNFVAAFLQEHQVPPIEAGANLRSGWRASWANYPLGASEMGARAQCEVALASSVKFLVTALGPPPPDIMSRCRKDGIVTGGLVGNAHHARAHVEAGVDVIIAQGAEAAAHTGDVGTMVLIPEIVDAVAPTPVLAAGGIASGRQMAAAMALGAEGIWTGSIWLTTEETDEPPEVVERLLAAKTTDTLRSRSSTGKPLRQLRSAWNAAWEHPSAPPMLDMPVQHLLTQDAKLRFDYHRRGDLTVIPVGQVVGSMRERKSVERVIRDLVEGYAAATSRVHGLSS